MQKTYIYRQTITAEPDTDVSFEVKFISDGNFGSTFINVPGNNDKTIDNEGQCSLGKIEDLTAERTIAASKIFNPASQEDTIKVTYIINGTEIVHENLKSEADDVMIFVIITFEV